MPHTGNYAFKVGEVIQKSQYINEHLILNKCVYLIRHYKHLIKGYFEQKLFIQIICTISIDQYISLINIDGMMFPCFLLIWLPRMDQYLYPLLPIL